MDAYVLCVKGNGSNAWSFATEWLVESLEVRNRGKDNTMGVPCRLLHQEVVLDETFHKHLEEASRLQVLVLMGDLNCYNIFWKTLTYGMSNAYECNI